MFTRISRSERQKTYDSPDRVWGLINANQILEPESELESELKPDRYGKGQIQWLNSTKLTGRVVKMIVRFSWQRRIVVSPNCRQIVGNRKWFYSDCRSLESRVLTNKSWLISRRHWLTQEKNKWCLAKCFLIQTKSFSILWTSIKTIHITIHVTGLPKFSHFVEVLGLKRNESLDLLFNISR